VAGVHDLGVSEPAPAVFLGTDSMVCGRADGSGLVPSPDGHPGRFSRSADAASGRLSTPWPWWPVVLVNRFGGYDRRAFDASSTRHVSVYQRATRP
jgi:hypothetical protein